MDSVGLSEDNGSSASSLTQRGDSLSPGRRAFLARTLGVSAGVVAVGAFTAPAVAAAPTIRATQDRWRFCNKCFALYFWGYPTDGVCPAGGAHYAQGYNFILPYDIPETPTAQQYWRFCTKCFSMYFWGYHPTEGVCPSGGAHAAQGYNFVLNHDVPETPTAQQYWRFCDKCFSMFFWGYSTNGVCPAGSSHRAQGYNFVLTHS
ncbi:MAG TPA: hypothetical protein VIU15_34065 [Streptomyces sp.]